MTLFAPKPNRRARGGFTLIELIAGVTAIAVLVSATVVISQSVITRSRDEVAVSRLTSLARMAQVKYASAQGAQTWEQVLVSATEEIRFTQGETGVGAADGIAPIPFMDTCNFDGTGCLSGQVSSNSPTQVSYKSAVITGGQYANQVMFGLALRSQSGNCVLLRANANAIIDAWSSGRDLEGDCRGGVALGGPSAESSIDPTDSAAIGIPQPATSPAADGTSPASGVVVTWKASSSTDVVSYRITRTGGATFNPVTVASSSACNAQALCSYTDTSAIAGESYTYVVTPIDGDGYLGRPVTIPVVTVPSAPTNFTATTNKSRIVLSWTRSTSRLIDGYKIYLNGSSAPATTAPATASSLTLVNGQGGIEILSGTTYDIALRAYNSGGQSSAATAQVTVLDVPTAPVLQPCVAGSSQVSLSWSTVTPTGSAPVSGYRVYVNGALLPYGETTASTSATITSLTNGTAYNFQVVAYGAGGEGTSSAAVSCTPIGAPAAPTGLSYNGVDSTSTRVTWSSPATSSAPVTGYEVYLDGALWGTTNTTSLTITGLVADEAHTVKVRGYNSGVTKGAFSANLTVYAYIIPPTPQNVAVSQSGEGELTVTWSAVSQSTVPVSGYRVYRDGSLLLGATTSSTSHTFTGLTLGGSHSFQVVSYHSFGESGALPPVTKTVIGAPSTPSISFTSYANNSANFAVTIPTSSQRPVASAKLVRCAADGTACVDNLAAISTTATSITGTGTAGVEYLWKLVTTNAVSTKTATTTVKLLNVAPAPQNVVATQSGEGTITFSWDAVSDPSYGITSYQGRFNGSTLLGGTTPSTSIEYSNLTLGQTYSFQVAARSTIGTGTYSSTVYRVAIGAPATPSIALSRNNETSATFSIDVADSAARPVSSVKLVRCDAGGSNCVDNVNNISPSATSVVGTISTAGTYLWKLVSTNAIGSANDTVSVTMTSTSVVPTGLGLTQSGDGELTASWDAITDEAFGLIDYQLKLNGSTAAGGTTSATSVTFTDLTPGNTYDVQVAGRNANGTGSFTSAVSAVAIAAPLVPTFSFSAYGDGQATFTIVVKSSTGRPVSSVKLQRCSYGGTNCVDNVTGITNDDTSVTGTATVGGTFTWKLISTNGVGFAAAATNASVYNIAPAPSGLAVSQSGSDELTVSWDAITEARYGVTGYQLAVNGSTLLGGTTSGQSSTSKSYTVNADALTAGQVYEFQVAARNPYIGTGTFSAGVSSTPISAPATPSISVASYNDKSITLTVAIPTSAGRPVSSAKLQRCAADGSSCVDVQTGIATSTTSLVASGTAGVTYVWKLVSTNVIGSASASTSALTVLNAPITPSNVVVTQSAPGEITVTWNPTVDSTYAITGYRLYIDGSNVLGGSVLGASSSEKVYTTLTNGTTYGFQVAAYNNVGESTLSSAVSGTPILTPTTPTLTLGSYGNGSVNFNVSASSSAARPIATLKLQRCDSNGSNCVDNATGLSAATTTVVGTGVAGTTYTWKLVATNPVATISSASVSATVASTAPQVTGVTVTQSAAGQLSVAWTPITAANYDVTGYRLYVDGSNVTGGSVLGAASASKLYTTLTAGTTYSFQVAAYNNVGEGAASASVNGTPINGPATPTIAVNSRSDGSISFNISVANSAAAPVTTYKLQRCDSNGLNCVDHVTGISTSATTVTGTGVAGSTYTWKLIATNVISTATATLSAQVVNLAPQVTGVSVTQNAVGQLTVNWTAITGAGYDITGYRLYVDGSNITGGSVTGASTATKLYTTLTLGTTYAFQVAAYNVAGEGSLSTSVNGTPISTPAAPTLTQSSYGSASVTFNVTIPNTSARPVSSVKLVRCNVGGTGCVDNVTGISTGASTVTGTGVAGTTYEWTLVSTNTFGSTNSTTATHAVYNLAPQVTGVTVTQSAAGQLTVAWTAITAANYGITGYRLYVDGSNITGGSVLGAASSSKLYTSLTLGTTYAFQVAAYNNVGEGTVSTAVNGTPINAPATPSISIASYGSSSVVFTTTIPSSATQPVVSVSLQRCDTNGANCAENATGTSASTTLTGTGTAGTAYGWKLVSTNALSSTTSSLVTATPLNLAPQVTGVSVTQNAAGQLTVNWTAITAANYDITGYRLYVDGSNVTGGTVLGAASSSKLYTTLTLGTTYAFQVAAYNNTGEGAASAAVNGTPINGPATPTIALNTYGDGTVTFNISVVSTSSAPVTTYKLQRCDSNGLNCVDNVTNILTSATTVTGTGTAGTTYTWKIVASNAISTTSATLTAQVMNLAPQVTGVSVTQSAAGELTVNWTAITAANYAITGYRLYVNGSNITGGSVTGAATATKVYTTLTAGTTYAFQVAAYNTAGEGAASASVNGTPINGPATPTISVNSRSDGSISFNISVANSAAAPVTSYKLQRCDANGLNCVDHVTGISTSATTVTGTGVAGTTYTWKLIATNVITSNTVALVAQVVNTVPAVSGVSVTQSAEGELTVAWTPITDAQYGVTDYQLWMNTSSILGGTATGASTSSKAYTGLTLGSSYSFQVAARNVMGTGTSSATVSNTAVGLPASPTLSASQYKDGSIDFATGFAPTAARPITNGDFYRCDSAGNNCTTISSPVTVSTTLINATGSTDGTTYRWKLRANNVLGSTVTTVDSKVYAIAPAPTGLTITQTGAGELTASWNAVTSAAYDVTGYQLFLDGSSLTGGQTVGQNVTTKVYTGLNVGQSYSIQVAARNASGTGTASSAVVTMALGAPDTPTIALTTRIQNGAQFEITVPSSASRPVSSAKLVRYNADGTSGAVDQVTNLTSASTTVNGTGTVGTTYVWKIVSINTTTGSTTSSGVSVTVADLPATPTGLSVTQSGNSQLTASWSAVPNVLDYQLRVNGSNLLGGTSVSTTKVLTGLQAGTSYTIEVSGRSDIGTGGYSTAVTRTAINAPTKPTISAGTQTNATVPLTLGITDTPASPASTVQLWRCDAGGANCANTGTALTGASTSATGTGTGGSSYYWYLVVTNALGSVQSDNTSTIDLFSSISVPTNVAVAVAAGDGNVTVTWTAVAGATDYQLYMNGSSLTGGTSATASKSYTGLTLGSTYYFQVAARNAAGTGVASSAVSIVPIGVPQPVIALYGMTSSTVYRFTINQQANRPIAAGTMSFWKDSTMKSSGCSTPITVTSATVYADCSKPGGWGSTMYITLTGVTNAAQSSALAATPVTFTYYTPLAAPTVTTSTNGEGQILVSWTTVTGVNTWTVEATNTTTGDVTTTTGLSSATLSRTYTGLTLGDAYSFKVRAVPATATQVGVWSSAATATVIGLPTAPTLSFSSLGTDSFTYTINTPTSATRPVSSVKLQRCDSAGANCVDNVPSVSIGATSVTGTGTGGNSYVFKLLSTNVAGTTTTTDVSRQMYTFFAAPTITSVTQSAEGALTVNWTAPTVNAATGALQDYQLTVDGSTLTGGTATSGATSKTYTGLTLGQSYSFQIAARSAFYGTSTFSGASSQTAIGLPSAPTLTFTSYASTAFNYTTAIDASSTARPITAVTLQRCDSAGANCVTNQTLTTATTSTTGTGTGGNRYTFKLVLANPISNVSTSDIARDMWVYFNAPTITSVTQSAEGSLTVNWTAPTVDATTGSISDYQLLVDGSTLTGGTAAAGATSKTYTGLTLGQTYSFQIAARSATYGTANISTATNQTAIGAPSAPTLTYSALVTDGVYYTIAVPTTTARPVATVKLVRCNADGTTGCVDNVTALTTASTTVTGTGAGGTTYMFKLVSTNPVASTTTADTARTVYSFFAAPSNVTVSRVANVDGSLTVSWTAPTVNAATGPIQDYQLTQDGSTITGGTAAAAATSKTYTGLTPGQTYTYQIAARSATYGTGTFSAGVALMALGLPAAPTFAFGTYASNGFNYTMTIPSATTGRPVDTVKLVRCDSAGANCVDNVTGLTTAATSVTGTGTGGTTYVFKLVLTNTVGSTTISDTARAMYTFLAAPTNVTVTQSAANALTVAWTAPTATAATGAISDYQLTQDGSTLTGGTALANATSKVYSSLVNGQTYAFAIAARNSVYGTSTFSSTVSNTAITSPNTATFGAGTYGNLQVIVPVSVAYTAGTPITSVDFQTCNSSGAACGAITNQLFSAATTNGSTATWNYTLTGTSATAYTVKATVKNSLGSAVLTSGTYTVYATPATPTGLTVTSGLGTYTVSWTNVSASSIQTGERLYWSTDNATWSSAYTIASYNGSAALGVAQGLVMGNTYYFKVSAYGPAGESAQSASVNGGLFADVPSAPSVNSVSNPNTALNQLVINFTFNSSMGSTVTAVTARCWAGTSTTVPSTGYLQNLNAAASSPVTVTSGFTSGTYSCAVYATNAKGNSAWSVVSASSQATYSYANYAYAAYSYAAYGYGNYAYAAYGYAAYGYVNYGYAAYGYAAYGYVNYGYAAYGYAAYGYVNYSYGNYGYVNYSYGNYGYVNYSYGNYGYVDYSYSNYSYAASYAELGDYILGPPTMT